MFDRHHLTEKGAMLLKDYFQRVIGDITVNE